MELDLVKPHDLRILMRNVESKIRIHYYHRQFALSLKKKKKSCCYTAICSCPKLLTWLFALLVRIAFQYSHHGMRVRLPTWC